MPRTARVALKGHVYHVLIRGINLQDIFEDGEDFRKYLYPYLEQDEPRADSTPFQEGSDPKFPDGNDKKIDLTPYDY